MSGRLIGVGVGPGDPELMTLKAARLISEAAVVAYPAANGVSNRTRAIAGDLIAPSCIELPFSLPMKTGRDAAQAVYDTTADQISAHLSQKQNVVVLCEGDPLFFGSFMYLAARLGARFPVDVVPGITSVNAAAASLRSPLVARNESLAVVPATAETAEITAALQAHDTVAILKVGRHMAKIRGILAGLDLVADARFVADASGTSELACALDDAPDDPGYFSLILAFKGQDPWLN